MDSCTTLGLRVDGKAALQEFESLPHAVEPKPSVRLFVFGIKAHTAITNREMNLAQSSIQMHVEPPHAAMLDRVVQGFL